MYIDKKTIEHFAAQGISVRWYPERDYEAYRKRLFDDYVKRYCEYYKYMDHSYDDLLKNARSEASICLKYKAGRDDKILYVEYEDKIIIKEIKTKSKEIDIAFINKLIEKNEKAYKGVYGNFALKMKKLLKSEGEGEGDFSIYPTTYGIGVCAIFSYHFKENVSKVEGIMKKYGVEYYNEYSDAGWAYRFKVSKKKENLAKITCA